MARIQIVTDSSAQFIRPQFVERNPVTIAYNLLEIGGKLYREQEDITNEKVIHLIAQSNTPPVITPPSVNDYIQLFTRVSQGADGIISIHTSRELSRNWHNAQQAARQLSGHCDIVVVDSQTVCAAQGILVQVAADAIQQFETMDECVRYVRGAVERLYMVLFLETVDYLQHTDIMKPSHVVLSNMLGIKPFLTIEEGYLRPIEKVRTRSQSVERLVEFVVEFEDLEAAAIIQSKPFIHEQTRTLQDRLAVEFPRQNFPLTVYGPSLAALIGSDARGVVILEQEYEEYDDDF